MKIYHSQNVYDAALARIRYLFDEFPNVICGVSGGKDSTVIFHLCLQVAQEKNRLPLRTFFLDQEAEWEATIEQVRSMMTHPDVEPMWMQIPIRLFNATSTQEHWLYCWAPEDEHRWMREREPYAYTENRYGTDRFGEMFGAIIAKEFAGIKTCYIAGMRTEESPTRFVTLTQMKTYKWITWAKTLSTKHKHYTFYPIYDWSYTDVWKAIHDNKWKYNSIYDAQYNYGVRIQDMRVSNVHHETAVHSLFYMQEVEPQTYVKLTQRISGIDMAGKLGKSDFFVHELPIMFASWQEYRDYLLDKLITVDEWRSGLRKKFAQHDAIYIGTDCEKAMFKVHINSILTNDWEHVKLQNWEKTPAVYDTRKRVLGMPSWNKTLADRNQK